jgi:release factor glutamine methyltransferase
LKYKFGLASKASSLYFGKFTTRISKISFSKKQMQSSKAAYVQLVEKIKPIYGHFEAKSMAFMFFEDVLGLNKTDIFLNIPLPQPFDFEPIYTRFLAHEPIQYIIGQAEFYGLKFLVDNNTLIPRNETEELVQLAIQKLKKITNPENKLQVLDIGTGSGCIAISIAKALDNVQVTAWDISENALEIAERNNKIHQTDVTFEQRNILDENINSPLKFDLIISNPPYVAISEKTQMHQNVLDWEPHLALFVEDENPLIFYEKIAQFAKNHLSNKGFLLFEINERFGAETCNCVQKNGFSKTTIFTDIHGKSRIVSAELA